MKHESERDSVCDRYQDYFDKAIARKDDAIMDELAFLMEVAFVQGYVKLGCFCAPRRCHGDTVKRFLNTVLNG